MLYCGFVSQYKTLKVFLSKIILSFAVHNLFTHEFQNRFSLFVLACSILFYKWHIPSEYEQTDTPLIYTRLVYKKLKYKK